MKAALLLRSAGVVAALLLAACTSLTPEKPVRPTLYDFGPGTANAPPPAPTQPAIVLEDVQAPASLESSGLLYRLAYADEHQLHPYARARWSAPPARLVRQRLREQLGRDRAVLDPSESASLARVAGTMPHVLHIELEEFSQAFDSPTQSWGVLRLRATLTANTPGGERLVGQRVFIQRQPAPTADASGGVRALTAATDAAAQAIAQWLSQQR
jgi:cholesterol transport system auxiliary component